MDLGAIAPLTMLARLGLAFLVGALIGLERERQHRPAGLRTHILVALASALFVMVSVIAAGDNNDPGRIAAQIVTGIGFLGAGTIMRYGSTVKGLTTAASLWMAAALGMAAGFGWYMGAIAAALLAFLVLVVVKALEERIAPDAPTVDLAVTALPGQNPLPALIEALQGLRSELKQVRIVSDDLTEGLTVTLSTTMPDTCNAAVLMQALRGVAGVKEVEPDHE